MKLQQKKTQEDANPKYFDDNMLNANGTSCIFMDP